MKHGNLKNKKKIKSTAISNLQFFSLNVNGWMDGWMDLQLETAVFISNVVVVATSEMSSLLKDGFDQNDCELMLISIGFTLDDYILSWSGPAMTGSFCLFFVSGFCFVSLSLLCVV